MYLNGDFACLLCLCLVQRCMPTAKPYEPRDNAALVILRCARVLARTVEHEEERSSVCRGRTRQAGQLAHCRITPCMKPFRLLIGAAKASSGWAGASTASKPREQRQTTPPEICRKRGVREPCACQRGPNRRALLDGGRFGLHGVQGFVAAKGGDTSGALFVCSLFECNG